LASRPDCQPSNTNFVEQQRIAVVHPGGGVLLCAVSAAIISQRLDKGESMTADELIEALGLTPHPEGGWYRETWRAQAADGERAAASAVLYVIQPGQRSHWNRVNADEIWLWHAGDAVELKVAASDAGPVRAVRLGGRVTEGEQVQVIVSAGQWQSAEPAGGKAGYTLISCIVAPAFEFSGFELATPGWEPDT
jgi:predicted cupin superfamily sugar epimerase